MNIVPDIIVVAPVAYVLMDYPPEVPLGLMISANLLKLLDTLDTSEFYQFAAQKDGQTLIMGFDADEYREMVDELSDDPALSVIVPFDEIRDDDQSLYLLTGGDLDGAPHLFALCSAYVRRDVRVGDLVTGCRVLERAEDFPTPPRDPRMMA